MISGDVISASSLTLLNSREWRSISIFYVKRIRRLLPALMFTVALGLAAIAFLIPPDNSKLEGFRTGLYSIVGMANIYLLDASTDYWRKDSLVNPFLHMWSLGVEFQNYVIIPILVFLFFRYASSSPLIRSSCLTISVFAGVASFFSFLLGETYELKKFYSAQYRIWEFAIGIGAYLCVLRFKGSYLRAGALVTSMRLILNDVIYTILISAFVFIGLEFMYRRSLTAFSCLITDAFMILNAHPASSTSSPLSNRLAVIIGDNSYSLYLVHFTVIFVFNYMMVFDTTWVYLSCILTIFALSYITWSFVAQSIRQRGSHKQVLRTTCATMLVAFVVADNSTVVRRLPFYSTIGLAANSDSFHNLWWTRLEETGHLFKHAATF